LVAKLPFILRTSHRPVERLRHLQAGSDPMDVHVRVELYTSSVNAVADSSQSMWPRVVDKPYADVIRFLQDVSEPAEFLPFDRLSEFSCRQYVLILSPACSHQRFEIFQMHSDASSTSFDYGGYEVTIRPRRYILDTAAYLVAQNKYTLFVRRVHKRDNIRFYRSNFINLAQSTPPHFKLDTQEILESVQLDLPDQSNPSVPIEQLLIFPTGDGGTGTEHLSNCPECGGQLHRISRNACFCLECDWDNLPLLEQP